MIRTTVIAASLAIAFSAQAAQPFSCSFRLLGGSRLEVSAMDTYVYVKLLLPPRQSRGVSPLTRVK